MKCVLNARPKIGDARRSDAVRARAPSQRVKRRVRELAAKRKKKLLEEKVDRAVGFQIMDWGFGRIITNLKSDGALSQPTGAPTRKQLDLFAETATAGTILQQLSQKERARLEVLLRKAELARPRGEEPYLYQVPANQLVKQAILRFIKKQEKLAK
ncbi:MAG: hypothetical protein NT067_05260 [Candidatus Diapherotrites archaeon]|nr:hypothetical protein [Candidatus Diapherotrites archaeon]